MIDSFSKLDYFCDSYDRIIVAGPQRTGTTFTAKSLSKQDKPYVDEFEHPTTDKWVWQFAANTHVVDETDCDLVVWMIRDIKDVLKSQDRINWWGNENAERRKYMNRFGAESGLFGSNYEMKLYYWTNHQKEKVANKIEFEYKNLIDSPLFLPEEMRLNFHPKQTFTK